MNVADQGNGVVGLLDGIEADLVVGRRHGLRGVGAGAGEETVPATRLTNSTVCWRMGTS